MNNNEDNSIREIRNEDDDDCYHARSKIVIEDNGFMDNNYNDSIPKISSRNGEYSQDDDIVKKYNSNLFSPNEDFKLNMSKEADSNASGNNVSEMLYVNKTGINNKLPSLSKSKSQSLLQDKQSMMIKKQFHYPTLNIRVFAIYKRVDYPLQLNSKTSVKTLRETISQVIGLPIDKMELKHKDKDLMLKENDNIKVYAMIIKDSYPFFEVQRKRDYQEGSFIMNALHPKMYKVKVLIENYPSVQEMYKHIDLFYKNNLIVKDYFAVPTNSVIYSISFPHLNIAFDFKRYLTILKATQPSFNNIKISVHIHSLTSSRSIDWTCKGPQKPSLSNRKTNNTRNKTKNHLYLKCLNTNDYNLKGSIDNRPQWTYKKPEESFPHIFINNHQHYNFY